MESDLIHRQTTKLLVCQDWRAVGGELTCFRHFENAAPRKAGSSAEKPLSSVSTGSPHDLTPSINLWNMTDTPKPGPREELTGESTGRYSSYQNEVPCLHLRSDKRMASQLIIGLLDLWLIPECAVSSGLRSLRRGSKTQTAEWQSELRAWECRL